MPAALPPPARLLQWQGIVHPPIATIQRIELIAGLVICALMGFLPFFERSGLALCITCAGTLWLLWSLCSAPNPRRLSGIQLWLLAFLGVAVLATGVSPVPVAAAKGLLKLVSYLGVYALMTKLLQARPLWWDRIVASLLGGALCSSVLALRQLYASTEELARWADPGSISQGTIRIYGPVGNPNLLAGYLLPIVPIALIACLRWQGWGRRLFAGMTVVLSTTAIVFTYSRGGWLGLLAALACLVLLLVIQATDRWPPFWRRVIPVLLLVIGGCLLAMAATQIEPIRVRVISLLAGRGDSSNNFRINVWLTAIEMIQDRPWLGIGPGNAAFNSIYPLYQLPKFNALSAYSVPLELLVELGIPGLIVSIGVLARAVAAAFGPAWQNRRSAGIAIASLAAIAGLITQGATDTIFFRPEVQLSFWFCLASLTALPELQHEP